MELKVASYAWLCIFFPLIGTILTPLFGKIDRSLRDYGAVFFSFLSALCSVMLLPCLFSPSALPFESAVSWLSVPVKISFGLLLDPLSIIMANVVSVISFFIMVYSLGYMKDDQAVSRYWMLMNGFIASMLLLVLANNLLFLFIGWKMVGLCSYGLIGYYYKDEKRHWIGGPTPAAFCTPSQAGLKALIMTSAGDVFLLGGILIIFFYSGSINFMELYKTSPKWIPQMVSSPGMVVLVVLMLLAGPLGKSAQFPMHEWLPEAMAGPTPVSALIHAATMVKSGVYLVARLVPVFYYAYWIAGSKEASLFFYIVAWIGAFTAFMAATQGLVSLELKKVLAYSTISQIGYMWLGLGVAGLTPFMLVNGFTSGIFHLINHALFKACLFLCAGSVIHAAGSIYMNEMGNLKKKMPLTWTFTLVAALSLIGVPPLSGFWSKDAVLLSCIEAGNYPLLILGLLTVILTSFYTIRFIIMVFHGKENRNIENQKEYGAHINDGYRSMWIPCGILAIIIVLAGFFGPTIEEKLRQNIQYMLAQQNYVSQEKLKIHQALYSTGDFAIRLKGIEEQIKAHPSLSTILPLLSILCLIAGAIPAYLFYVLKKARFKSMVKNNSQLKSVYIFLKNRWYVDKFYYKVIVDGFKTISSFVAEYVENSLDFVYHRFLPSAPAAFNRWLSGMHTESNYLFHNLAYILVLLILIFILLSGRS